MGWMARGVVAAAMAAGSAVVGRRLAARTRSGGESGAARPRWHTLTVNRPVDEVAPGGRLPEPLARLGETVEVRLRAAPGGRGTEIAVRLRDGEPPARSRLVARLRGADPRWPVRRALRDSRSLLETGEVLRPSGPPTTRRTLRSRPLEYATMRGCEEGLL